MEEGWGNLRRERNVRGGEEKEEKSYRRRGRRREKIRKWNCMI